MFRFFTVYGPQGRPDMAPMIFANSILNSQPIKIYNHGNMSRDFTYIDDLVNGIRLLIEAIPGASISNYNYDDDILANKIIKKIKLK